MPAACRHLAWAALAVMAGLAGCRTPDRAPPQAAEPAPAPSAGDAAEDSPLESRPAALAESLANYAAGLIREAARDDRAASNFTLAVASGPDAIRPYLRLAGLRLRQGDKAGALAVMREASRRHPDSLDLLFSLGAVAMAAGDTAAAELAFQEAIRLQPGQAATHLKLAMLYLELDREDEALALLEKALPLVEDSRTLLRFLGDHFARQVEADAAPDRAAAIRRAIGYYERAARGPQDSQSLVYTERLGGAYLMDRRFRKAAACFQAVADAQPGNAQNWKRLAYAHMALGRREEAIACLRKVADSEPDNLEINYPLGELYEGLGDLENAEACYLAAARAAEFNPLPVLKLALLLTEFDPDAAIATLESALLRAPGDLRLLEALAHLCVGAGRPADALAVFERMQDAVARSGDGAMALRYYLQYAAMAEENEQRARAADLYEKAMAADPDALEPYVRLAFLLLGDRKPDDAFAAMRRAAARFQDGPDEPMAHLYLGIVYSRAERYADAVASFQKAEALARRLPDPEVVLNAMFAFSYGAACERLGRREQAETLLEQALELDPDYADAYNYLAYMWAEKAVRLDQALAYVTRALELEPDNGAYVDTLGWILYQQRRYPEALAELERAHRLMPEDPTVLDHLGDAHAALDRYEDAIACWTRSLALDPANDGVRRKLADLGAEPAPEPPAPAAP